MARYVCQTCNYQFESKYDQYDKQCPYCGKREVVKEPSAEDLLKNG